LEALDEGKEIRVIFFDISKAFDRVWHRGLLFKLKKMGIVVGQFTSSTISLINIGNNKVLRWTLVEHLH
jgi:Fe2+ transport system protein FeoA